MLTEMFSKRGFGFMMRSCLYSYSYLIVTIHLTLSTSLHNMEEVWSSSTPALQKSVYRGKFHSSLLVASTRKATHFEVMRAMSTYSKCSRRHAADVPTVRVIVGNISTLGHRPELIPTLEKEKSSAKII